MQKQYVFSASYNIFDNWELLPTSIKQIRNNVDFISVIYQNLSNYKQKADENMLPFLQDLVKTGLVDKIEEYKIEHFGSNVCHRNELLKRQRGQELGWLNGCTHHLSIDADEMYDEKQFSQALQIIADNDYDATYSHIQDYKYNPQYQVKGLADYFVPFFNKISTTLTLGFRGYRYCDPTRSVSNYLKPYQFSPEELIMHHFTQFRNGENGLRTKLENSSARQNFKDINQMISEMINYQLDETCIEVEDKFNLKNVYNIIK